MGKLHELLHSTFHISSQGSVFSNLKSLTENIRGYLVPSQLVRDSILKKENELWR